MKFTNIKIDGKSAKWNDLDDRTKKIVRALIVLWFALALSVIIVALTVVYMLYTFLSFIF